MLNAKTTCGNSGNHAHVITAISLQLSSEANAKGVLVIYTYLKHSTLKAELIIIDINPNWR